MKNLIRIFITLGLASSPAFAQTVTLTQTSLSASITANATTFALASATNVSVGTMLYVDKEAMYISAISGASVTVGRGEVGTASVSHASGAMVLAGPPAAFFTYPPTGSCTASATPVTPWVDIRTSAQYLCSSVTGTWVAGWQNDLLSNAPTAAVASAAGLITPSGPLFHVTGTAAITGFNIPVGFAYGSFTIIPDGTFTTTNANNIALASTAVVSKALTFIYDPATGKFYPGY